MINLIAWPMPEYNVRISGYAEGAIKVAANHALEEVAGIRLAQAKEIIDRVLIGESVTVTVSSESNAHTLAKLLTALNFVAIVERR